MFWIQSWLDLLMGWMWRVREIKKINYGFQVSGLSNWMNASLIKMGNTTGGANQAESMDLKVYFCLVKFELPIRYLSGDVENAIGYMRLEMRRDLYQRHKQSSGT